MINYTYQTAACLLFIPPLVAGNSIYYSGKTTVGLVASALSIFTLGKIKSINDYASLTVNASNILRPFTAVVQIFNPYTKPLYTFKNGYITEKFINFIYINAGYRKIGEMALTHPKINKDGKGVSRIIESIYVKAQEAARSNSFWSKHFVSRGVYALGALGMIVTRTMDLALGVIGVFISVIPCFGRIQSVNQFAFTQLAALDLINDLCIGLRGFVNPQQFVKINTVSKI